MEQHFLCHLCWVLSQISGPRWISHIFFVITAAHQHNQVGVLEDGGVEAVRLAQLLRWSQESGLSWYLLVFFIFCGSFLAVYPAFAFLCLQNQSPQFHDKFGSHTGFCLFSCPQKCSRVLLLNVLNVIGASTQAIWIKRLFSGEQAVCDLSPVHF